MRLEARSKRRPLTAVGLALALAAGAVTAAETPVFSPLVQRERTVLVLVDARVEDAAGRPVRGLGPDDFTLIVDGRKKAIDAFEEIVSPAPRPAEAGDAPPGDQAASPSYFVFFFDNILSNHFERRQAALAADRILENVLREEDRFTVVALGRRLKVLSPMTRVGKHAFSSFGDLLADPEVLDPYGDEREYRLQEVEEQYEIDADKGIHLARTYAVVEGNRVHQVLDVVRKLLTALEAIRERKQLLYFSTGVPQYPGAEYMELVELEEEIPYFTRMTLSAVERLFREANSGRTSIFPVDVAGLDGPREWDRISGARDGLISLALNTGGKAVINTNDLSGTIGDAVASSRHYYLLGFTPGSGGDDAYHSIKVKVRNRRWRVRARNGFLDFSSAEMSRRQVLGSFVLPEMFTELPLRLEMVPLERRGRGWLAEAQLRIPLESLARLPRGAAWAGQVEMGANFFRGATLQSRFDRAVTLEFPAAFVARGELVIQEPLRLQPGPYQVLAVTRDVVGGVVGGARLEFQAPRPDSRPILALGRLVGQDVLPPPPEAPPERRARWVARDRPVIWAAGEKLVFGPDDVLVLAYVLPGDGGEPPWITHRLLRGGEILRASHPSVTPVGPEGESLAAYEEIRAADLGPGLYTVTVTVGRGAVQPLTRAEFRIADAVPAAASGAAN
jgi:VWFA-related protein